MILKWRDKEYKFENGTLEYDEGKNSDVDNMIFGFDTESVEIDNGIEIQTIQISSNKKDVLKYIKTGTDPLLEFFEEFWQEYQDEIKNEKDIFLFGYNIIYDWGQLIKKNEKLYTILKTGIGQQKKLLLYDTGILKIFLKGGGLFTGNAPFWTIIINYGRKKYLRLHVRDAWSYFSGGLSKASKMLGIETKKEREEDLGKIDYRNMQDNKRKQDFEIYAKTDARVTRLLGEKIRELHKTVNLQKIKVSSPGYAITLLLKSHNEKLYKGIDNIEIMQMIIDSYSGGRTGGIYHGYVENMYVFDIHSSYSTSMEGLPSFTKTMHYIDYDDIENLSIDEFIEIANNYHCFVTISGFESNNKYPTLVTNKKNNEKHVNMLTPIYGAFEKITSTGVEILIGINNKTLTISKIHKLIILSDEYKDKETGWRKFVSLKYNDKKSKIKDSIEYTSAKLCLNAGYGKLIESRTETYIDDEIKNIIVPLKINEVDKYANVYYQDYLECDNKKQFEQKINNLLEEIEPEDNFIYKTFGELSLTKLEYGRYAIPAAASLITAMSRSRLLALMISFSAKYWDTDSIFTPDIENINEKINNANKLLSKLLKPIKIGKELGDIDCEIENAKGYLAGIKRYNIYNDKGDKKIAVHGVPSVNYNEVDNILEKLATGYNIEYEGRAKPNKAKTSKINTLGKFEQKKYTSIFELDSRLNWTKVNNGWCGTVKEFSEV